MSDVSPSSVAVDGPPRTVRVSKLHVPADLTLYAALAGFQPEIDPALADPVVAAARARQANPWSPSALSVYVREVVRQKGPQLTATVNAKVAATLNRPELAAWVRRQSAVARRRLTETHRRVSAAAFTVGAGAVAESDED